MTQDKYVLVPSEPTEEMLIEGRDFLGCTPSGVSIKTVGNVWEAMLSAAPTIAQPITPERVLELCAKHGLVFLSPTGWDVTDIQLPRLMAVINELPSQNESAREALEKLEDVAKWLEWFAPNNPSAKELLSSIKSLINADEREG